MQIREHKQNKTKKIASIGKLHERVTVGIQTMKLV